MALSDQEIISKNNLLAQSSRIYIGPNSQNTTRTRFSLTLKTNVANGRGLYIEVRRNLSNILTILKTFTTVETSVPATNVVIGTSVNKTMENFYEALMYYNNNPDVNYTLVGNTIHIDYFNTGTDTYDIYIDSNTTGIVITGPFTASGISQFDRTRYIVEQWEGFKYLFSTPIVPETTWKIVKFILSPKHIRTYVDVAPVARDGFQLNTDHYRSNTIVQNLPKDTSRWVKVTATNQLGENDKNKSSLTYFTLNGWSEDNNHFIPDVLMNGRVRLDTNDVRYRVQRVIHRGAIARIFYHTSMLNTRAYVYGDRKTAPIYTYNNISGNDKVNTEYIKSVRVQYNNASTQPIERFYGIEFVYVLGDESSAGDLPKGIVSRTLVEYEILNECKYPVIEILFKNRYGILETTTFGKVSHKTLQTKRETAEYSIVDINGVSHSKRHSNKHINVDGDEVYELNTDFVPEYMNACYEDLFMSDEVYIRDPEGGYDAYRPVLLMDSDFKRKAKVTDGLINYNFKFKLSHRKKYNLV